MPIELQKLQSEEVVLLYRKQEGDRVVRPLRELKRIGQRGGYSERAIAANDAVGGGASERDAIQSLNTKKGIIKGKDSSTGGAVPPEQEPPEKPARVQGSDTAAEAPNSPNAPELVDDGRMLVTKDELTAIITAGIAKHVAPYQTQLAQIQTQLAEKDEAIQAEKDKAAIEKDKLQQQIETEKKHRSSLANVFQQFGYSVPGVTDSGLAGTGTIPYPGDAAPAPQQVYISPSSNRGGMINPRDAMREFGRMLDSRNDTPTMVVVTQTGELFEHRDTRNLRRFIRDNREPMRKAMEDLAKHHGLLRGPVSQLSDAPTTIANVPPAFLTYLSEVTRLEHSSSFILWQFVNRAIANGVPPGQTSLVPRVRHITTGTSSSAWQLTPGVPLTGERQPVQAAGQPIVILENGMGKDPTIPPVSIPDFILAYSLINLESVVQQRIGYNYELFEDLAILEMMLSTTATVYNQNGSVVTAAGQVLAGGGGQLTVDFLGALFAHMSTLKIPSYRDGCYVLAVHPNAIAQLQKDLRINHQYVDKSGIEELTNMLFMTTGNDMGKVSGYVGKIAGFHIFQGNSFSVGAVGTAGVQAENMGGVTGVTTRSCFAFGRDSMGWATAMPMSIKESDDTDFGRARAFVWRSHEGWGPLDVDPNSNPPASNDQQLRMLEVRLSDREL